MKIFDLAISYKWVYDEDFIDLIEKIFQSSGLTTFVIQDHNVSEITELVRKEKIGFKAYLDRASDLDTNYELLAQILTQRNTYIINPHSKAEKAINKSLTHTKLINSGFNVPKTIIVPSCEESHELNVNEDDLKNIGKYFIIKPSFDTGGGEGVIYNATSLEQIQKERLKYTYESYLIQEIIHPKMISDRRAWFRVFWVFDKVIPSWWDDKIHIYNLVTEDECKKYNLDELYIIVKKLAYMVGLDYFSTEVALTEKNEFILIDYINDQCDMRLKSKHTDGVPDELVIEFINRMKIKVSSLQ